MREHEKIPYDSLAFQEYWGEGMRLPRQSKGLDRWFFQWQWRNSPRANDDAEFDQPFVTESGYYASYVIGAQWFDKNKTMPLVVTTKYGCDRIDFLKMFSVCFNSGIEDLWCRYGTTQDKSSRTEKRPESSYCSSFPVCRERDRQARIEERLCSA